MRKLFYLLIASCVLFACSKNPVVTTSPGVQGLMPLQIGNEWVYQKNFIDSTTGNIDSTGGDTIAIISESSVNNIAYYQQIESSEPIDGSSFFYNADSVTVMKIDSATQYTFFKQVNASSNGAAISQWADTVKSRCAGHNNLYGYSGDTTIGTYTNCLKNVVQVTDCTGLVFEQWVYYLQPGTGLVRIENYALRNDGQTLYLKYVENLSRFSHD